MSTLVDKLHSVTEGMSGPELENYKLLLGIAAGGLSPDGSLPSSGPASRAFETVLRCLAKVQPTGAIWRGRPDFMSDQLLDSLQAEARANRIDAIRHDRYYLGCGGAVADSLALSTELVELVNQVANGMVPTGVASYLWYDEPGCGLSAHIDTETFTLNGILMLEHRYSEAPSHLVLLPPGGTRERVLLQPGELLLLFAGGTVHARENVKPGESVSLLTIGFRPS